MCFPKLACRTLSWLIVLHCLVALLQAYQVESLPVTAKLSASGEAFRQGGVPGKTVEDSLPARGSLLPLKRHENLAHEGGPSTWNRGFVICVGGPGREADAVPDAVRTVAAIKSVRRTGNHNLVMVFHVNGELPENEIALLTEYKGVMVHDLKDTLDKDDMAAASGEVNKFRSFDCKIMALLHSPFKQTILIDSDTLFFKDPDTAFHRQEVKDSGTLFFYDRRAVDNNPHLMQGKDKCKSIIDFAHWSDMKTTMLVDFKRAHLAYCDGLTSHEQDASMVVVDSTHPAATKFLHMLKQFHTKFILKNETVQQWGFGDKEFYWIACEFAGVRCSFSPRGRPMHIFFKPDIGRQSPLETESPGCSTQVALDGDGSDLLYANLSDKYCPWDQQLNAVTVWNPEQTSPTFHQGWVVSTGRGVRPLTSAEQLVANNYRDDVARLTKV